MRIFRKILSQRGFTLIELAMVLVVIGLLIGLGMGLIGPLTKRAKYTETKEIVNAAVESVISYGAANNKLPDSAAFPAVVRNPNDAFTKALIYVYDNNLTSITTGGICGRKTTGITVGTTPNVAFVVISGSDDYTIDTTLNGTLNGSPINGVITGSGYITGTITVNDNDIIKWITLDELRIKAGCQGAQLKILNNELPSGFQCSSYSATITADGGVPFASGGYYRWCRQESITAGLTFNPSTLDTNCQVLTETSWGQNNNLIIYGTPTYCGTFQMTFFARDNNDPSAGNDNIAQKALALTVNPATSGCTAGYRVWNQTGSRRDFSVDGVCVRANNGAEITNAGAGRLLNSCEAIDRYSTNNGSCGGGIQQQMTYCQAMTVDMSGDGDCQVNFTLAGATDR